MPSFESMLAIVGGPAALGLAVYGGFKFVASDLWKERSARRVARRERGYDRLTEVWSATGILVALIDQAGVGFGSDDWPEVAPRYHDALQSPGALKAMETLSLHAPMLDDDLRSQVEVVFGASVRANDAQMDQRPGHYEQTITDIGRDLRALHDEVGKRRKAAE